MVRTGKIIKKGDHDHISMKGVIIGKRSNGMKTALRKKEREKHFVRPNTVVNPCVPCFRPVWVFHHPYLEYQNQTRHSRETEKGEKKKQERKGKGSYKGWKQADLESVVHLILKARKR